MKYYKNTLRTRNLIAIRIELCLQLPCQCIKASLDQTVLSEAPISWTKIERKGSGKISLFRIKMSLNLLREGCGLHK
jgi:hypothetical protein